MEGKNDRMSEFDHGALERDLLESDFMKQKAVEQMKRYVDDTVIIYVSH